MNKKGCKNTRGRKAVVEALERAKTPLSAEEIYFNIKESGTSINLSTVYRNLELMEKSGFIDKTVMNDNKSRFELIGDEHRHHLICTDCSRMVPIDTCPLVEYEKDIKRETEFDITGHQLILYGICPDCKKKN